MQCHLGSKTAVLPVESWFYHEHCFSSSLSPAVHIQANLEDDLVKEALKTVSDRDADV